ncbi:MAG: hypothetical protein IKA99_07845 [Clostridia bacterium]|nr:hypothetical protein [Clostridia bacterium]
MKIHSKENLYGIYSVPSDKSITSRAIVLGSIAKGKTYVVNPLMCEDTLTVANCMKKLGAKVKLKGRILEIKSVKKDAMHENHTSHLQFMNTHEKSQIQCIMMCSESQENRGFTTDFQTR